MKKQYLEAGRIVGTHALKGEVRVEVWCDTVDVFCNFKHLYFEEGKTKLKIKSKPHKRIAISKIDGIDTVEQADLLRGKVLFLDRNDLNLDEGEYFIQDIVGLNVIDVDSNELYGEVTDVLKTGSNDVYEMKTKENKTILIPVIDDIVKDVNIDDNFVLIKPMKGLFTDED